MKRWLVLLVVLVTASCGAPEPAVVQPTAAPIVVTQIVVQVVTATPLPATATPKPTATPEPTTAPTERPTATPNPVGEWVVSEEKSSFDDSKKVVLTLDAKNDITGLSGTVRPSLVVRCQEHAKEVYVYTGIQPDVEADNLDGATVRIRFDKEKSFPQIASKSTDGNSLFLDVPLIEDLLKHQQMVFGFTPFSSNPVEMTFDLRGLAEAIKPLNEACK